MIVINEEVDGGGRVRVWDEEQNASVLVQVGEIKSWGSLTNGDLPALINQDNLRISELFCPLVDCLGFFGLQI